MAASAYREVHRPTTVSASYHGAFERLERLAGKLARAVPRGGGGGNVTSLPDPDAPAGPTIRAQQKPC